jgi:hypothetical protein
MVAVAAGIAVAVLLVHPGGHRATGAHGARRSARGNALEKFIGSTMPTTSRQTTGAGPTTTAAATSTGSETNSATTTEGATTTAGATTTTAGGATATTSAARLASSDASVVGSRLSSYDAGAFTATPLSKLGLRLRTNTADETSREWLGGPGGAVEERVDMSPGGNLTPAQMAAPQLKSHAHQPGYQLVSTGSGGLSTHPSSFQWVFSYRGNSYVDWFFTQCSHYFAVLGVSPRSDFVKYFPVFTDFVNSVRATCQ